MKIGLFFKQLAKGSAPVSLPAFDANKTSQIAVNQSDVFRNGMTPDLFKQKLESKFNCKLQDAVTWKGQFQYNIERNIPVEVDFDLLF
jgi:hypothetical protein